MQQTLPILILSFAALACVVGFSQWWHWYGGGRYLRELAERQRSERETGARLRGWHCESPIGDDIRYRIHGHFPDGTGWCIHYDSDQASSSARPHLVFQAPFPGLQRQEWSIQDKQSFLAAQKAASRPIIGSLARLGTFLSQGLRQKHEFFAGAASLNGGSTAFTKHYVLAACDTRWISLVDRDVEQLALHWPFFQIPVQRWDRCFSASLTSDGLRLQLECDAPDFAVVEHMQSLGQHLMANCWRIRPAAAGASAAVAAFSATGIPDRPPRAA